MSNSLDVAAFSANDPVQLAQQATDELLAAVTDQITLDTFDPNDQALLQRLVDCLGDLRGLVRLRCAETLGEIGEPATPFLIKALAHHENAVVRRAAAKTLTLIADPTSIPTLVHALFNDEDTVVKGSAIGALARIGEASVPILLDILASPDRSESMKGHAAWALAFIGAEAKDYLYREIGSDSAEVRYAVVGAIAKVVQDDPNEDRAFELLVQALSDPAAMVRCEAASALGNLAYQPAIPHFLMLLSHPDWESRKAAALALMKAGDRSAIVPLQSALDQELETAVQSVLKLAISQLERRSNEA
ncbi:MAG: HEAT repeat domain-containing protein [Thermosynechococcaceae cyanobacterium]